MPLTAGTRLGPYEITAPLGSGGMGEVYRARDTRLGREVAVKVLPASLSSSPEVRARFEREARTVSSLNHPHICVLHDVGHEAGTDFLVMELVEGETLAQRIARGALPVADLLRIGGQIADALDRAHRAGVIHRDLKPGNVMLARSGAKLMDFGLARPTGLAGPGGSGVSAAMTQSPTMAAPLTAEGSIVGTFQYMAPEQLEGREADARSDLWALGCVLYEMATGRRAFEGATQASLISAIMRDQPRPMSQLAPLSPPALERVVGALLAKDPDDRWQSAADVRRELEWTASGDSSAGSSAGSRIAAPLPALRRRLPSGAWGLGIGAAIAALALLYAFGPGASRRETAPLVRFSIASPPGTTLPLPAEAQLSPDGRTIVFTANDSLGASRLFLRPLASRDARALPGTEGASEPFWSPDGRMLGFFANGRLRRVALDGSPPVDLCDAPDPRGGAWSTNGTIVFAPNNQGGLLRVSAGGGQPTPVTAVDTARHERGHRYPQFLPDGRHFLYVALGTEEQVSTYLASLSGEKPVEVARAGSMARYAPPGYLLYLDGEVTATHHRLLARRFDAGRGRASGEEQLVLDRVEASNFGCANLTAAAGGGLVTQRWQAAHLRLEWRDWQGNTMGVAVQDLDGAPGPLSPDGTRLAYSGNDPRDLYVLDMVSGVSTRLTFENHDVSWMCWSPDGRRIAFARVTGSRGWECRLKSADGSGPDSMLFHGPGLFSYPLQWSRDGRWLLMRCTSASGNFDLWRMPMTGAGKPEVYQQTAAEEGDGCLSPDGRWVAYVADENGKPGLYVQSFPEPGARYQVAISDPAAARWSRRGDALGVITRNGDPVLIQVSTAGGFRQGAATRRPTLPRQPRLEDISPDEQRLLMGSRKDLTGATSLEVVLGWTQLLEKR